MNDTNEYQMYRGFDTWMAGPALSLPVSEKFRLEFTPKIGYAQVYLRDEQDLVKGNGVGFDFSGSLVYDLSKRCSMSLETGYLTSQQTYKHIGKNSSRTVDLEFGLAYKFGKRSL